MAKLSSGGRVSDFTELSVVSNGEFNLFIASVGTFVMTSGDGILSRAISDLISGENNLCTHFLEGFLRLVTSSTSISTSEMSDIPEVSDDAGLLSSSVSEF